MKFKELVSDLDQVDMLREEIESCRTRILSDGISNTDRKTLMDKKEMLEQSLNKLLEKEI